MRKKVEKLRSIYVLLETKNLSKKEKRRVAIFLEKKKVLDALPHQPCENCGKMIPSPSEYCSSKCGREKVGKERNTKDEPKRAQKTLS